MNSKKLFAVLLLLVMLTCLLSGCNSTTDSSVEKPETTVVPTHAPPTVGTFVVINSKQIFKNTTQYIMYDPETMVMWSALYSNEWSNVVGEGVGISHSPMYNADGTLRI